MAVVRDIEYSGTDLMADVVNDEMSNRRLTFARESHGLRPAEPRLRVSVCRAIELLTNPQMT